MNDAPKFQNVETLSDADTEKLLINITSKILKHLRRKGYLNREGDGVDSPLADGLFTNQESLAEVSASSTAGKIAFGPIVTLRELKALGFSLTTVHWTVVLDARDVTRIGSGFGYGEETPLVKGNRCCTLNCFSLHANTATKTLERDKLYRLIEYIARGPISNKRLEITKAGLVKLQLKTPWSDGTSHLLFTKEEFLEKHTALIPPPRAHLVKWAGIFSPNSPMRPLIVLNPKVKKGFQFKDETEKTKVKNPCIECGLSLSVDVSSAKSCKSGNCK